MRRGYGEGGLGLGTCLAAAGLLEWGTGQLERFGEAAQSVLRVAEAGLSRVGVEPFFETRARAAVFICESPFSTGSR